MLLLLLAAHSDENNYIRRGNGREEKNKEDRKMNEERELELDRRKGVGKKKN